MSQLDQTFSALADPTRRGIVVRLTRGKATVSELVKQFDVSQPTISSHLKVLEAAGLISRTREAQTRPCQLEADRLREVNDWLTQLQQAWEGNYQRLDALLSEIKQTPPERKK